MSWCWDSSCEESYQLLSLAKEPVVLVFPDWGKPFHLEVDASSEAVGGVLTQEDEQGHRRPISFFSSTLNPPQRKYSVGEREAWAIVSASRKWRKYLQAAASVVIWIDHNPLVWIRKQKDPRGKYGRWILELEPLNYVVKYRRGADNLAADHLSRSPTSVDDVVNDDLEFFEGNIYSVSNERSLEDYSGRILEISERIIGAQRRDKMTADAMMQLQRQGVVRSGQLKKFSGLKIREGILYRRNRIVIPTSLREEVLEMVHRAYHGGVQRTIDELKLRFYWRGMYADTESFCKRCMICLKNKRSYSPKQPLSPIKLDYELPRAMIACDVATLPWTKDGFTCSLLSIYSPNISRPSR